MNRSTILLLLAASCSATAFAQTDSGRLAGTVADPAGAVVAGATVKVLNQRTGVERTVVTSETGIYIVPQLTPAPYTVTGSAPGLGPTSVKDVVISVGQERTLNLIVQPSATNQEVTVSGGSLAVLETSSASIGTNVSAREVAELPLNGRQISQLYLQAPGAVNNGSGSFDDIRFSGRANEQNAVRFDGIEGGSIIDSSPGNLNGEQSSFFRLQSSLENVQEFRVDSNNYPAEYGTGTGGQISIITKSGSNAVHGSLFEYLRNSAMDARDYFDTRSGGSQAPLRLNQFGGSIGGAAIKDKFFYFFSMETLKQRIAAAKTEGTLSRSARTRAVAATQPLLAAFPLGDRSTSNADIDLVTRTLPTTVDEYSGGVRLDYRFNEKYSSYVRYFRDQGYATQIYDVSGSGLNTTAAPQNLVATFNQILSPTVLNETKVGLNLSKTRYNGLAPTVAGVDFSNIAVNIGGSVALPGIAGQGNSAGYVTPAGLNRANSASNGRGQPYTNYSLAFIDNLSYLHSNHNMKFGFEYRKIQIRTDRLGGATYTFNSPTDFLANNLASVQVLADLSQPSPFNGIGGIHQGDQFYAVGYAQDEWKIRPSVTISYGLRYEYYSVMNEAKNRDVVFNIVTGTLMDPKTPFYKSSKLNFGPRLAISYAPTALNNKTVLRIGAGYYYGPGQEEDQIQPIESDRVIRTLTSGVSYPVSIPATIAGFDLTANNTGFQPRAYAPGYQIPEKILQYTFSLQQQLPGQAIFTAAYVGSQGRNLFLRSISNKIVSVDTNPVTGAAIVNREFGNRFAEVDYKTSGGNDHYDSLQMTLNRRFSSGFTMGSQYTWGHTLGNTSGSNEARTAANNYSFAADHGDNNFDIRHSMNASALYEVPFGKGRKFGADSNPFLNILLGGWQLGGIVNARSGVPIEVNITRADIVYRDNKTGAIYTGPVVANGVVQTTAVVNVPGGGNSRNIRRPDYIAGVNPYVQTSTGFFINPAAFALPAPGTFGNLGRNALKGPRLAQLDLTLGKKFRVTERANLEFRAEIYNILNHANFAVPASRLGAGLPSGTGNLGAANTLQPGQAYNPTAAGGTFGLLTSTVSQFIGQGTNRQIQLALRLNF